MKGLEEFLANLLEHVRSGHVTVALSVVLAVLFGPVLWHLVWRCVVLRKIESAYLARIQYLEHVAEREQTLAKERISLLEKILKERDDLLRERDEAMVGLLEDWQAQGRIHTSAGDKPTPITS